MPTREICYKFTYLYFSPVQLCHACVIDSQTYSLRYWNWGVWLNGQRYGLLPMRSGFIARARHVRSFVTSSSDRRFFFLLGFQFLPAVRSHEGLAIYVPTWEIFHKCNYRCEITHVYRLDDDALDMPPSRPFVHPRFVEKSELIHENKLFLCVEI